MTRRIFVNVKRGITDNTAVCIFPWEQKILERIHGGDVEEVSIDQMCELKGHVKVEKLKFTRSMEDGAKAEQAPNLRAQLEAMVVVSDEEDPAHDPDGEYNRLESKYGMDKEVNMPVVTIIYGQLNSGAFAAAVRESQGGLKGVRQASTAEKPVSEMSINEVRTALKDAGIEYDRTAKLPALRDLLATATA